MINLVIRNFRINSLNLHFFSTKSQNVTKKQQEIVKKFVQTYIDNDLPDKKLEDELKPLKNSIKTQGELVRQLKNDKTIASGVLEKAVLDLTTFKLKFQNKVKYFYFFVFVVVGTLTVIT
jgi:hypothetical protein